MNRRRPPRRAAGIGLAAALVAFVAVAFGGGLPLPAGDPAQTITADVVSSGDLRAGDDVRVDGVRVGKVASVDLAPGARHARVRLAIDDHTLEVHADARLALRWRTVLGGAMFADLDPGTPGTPPLGDRPLTTAQTSAQTELDDVVALAKGTTAPAVRTLLGETAKGLHDPADLRGLLREAPRLPTIARGLAPLRGSRAGDLPRLIRAAARVTSSLGADRHRLADLVTGADGTFGTIADHRRPLAATLQRAPAALAATDRLLVRVTDTLPELDPLADALVPGLRALTRTAPDARRTLTDLADTAAAARPLLRELPPTVGGLARAATPLRQTLDGLRPILAKSLRSLLPWLDRRDPQTKLKTYEAIGPTAAVAGHPEYDAGGFFLPFPADIDEDGLQDGPQLTRRNAP